MNRKLFGRLLVLSLCLTLSASFLTPEAVAGKPQAGDRVQPDVIGLLVNAVAQGLTAAGNEVYVDGTTVTVGGDFVMTVDDGSGPLEVVLDKDITFNLTPLIGGVVVDVTGVLVPTGGGAWQLKARSAGDVIIK